MSRRSFDERYPAMFQPGGEGAEALVWAPAEVRGETAVPSRNAQEPEHPVEPDPLAVSAAGPMAMEDETLDPPPWPPRLWLGILAAAIAMIAGGVFALTAQYWVPSAMEIDPSKFGGVLSATLGVAGWAGMYAMAIFPEALTQWSSGKGQRYAMPWTYMVGGSGMWLFILALGMVAVLVVVPQRRHNARPLRGLLLGAALWAAGMFAMFAPYIYPTATGTVIVELSGGGQAAHQDWAALARNVVTPLLLAACLVIGWALVSLVSPARTAPEAEVTVETRDDAEP